MYENSVPDKLSLEGKVVQRAECRPINDKTYMTLIYGIMGLWDYGIKWDIGKS